MQQEVEQGHPAKMEASVASVRVAHLALAVRGEGQELMACSDNVLEAEAGADLVKGIRMPQKAERVPMGWL